MSNENASSEYWQTQLDEITDELSAMTGAGTINIGTFSIDQAQAYAQLMKQKAHAEHMLARLGSAGAQDCNVIVSPAELDY